MVRGGGTADGRGWVFRRSSFVFRGMGGVHGVLAFRCSPFVVRWGGTTDGHGFVFRRSSFVFRGIGGLHAEFAEFR